MENGEDEGGQLADYYDTAQRIEMMAHIKDDRKRRVKQLAGKYVVATIGKSSKNIVYYQDQKVSDGGYWTQYLSNAQGFRSLQDAQQLMSGFEYGKPRIGIVLDNGNVKWI